jgi:hypothetical protein
MTSKCLLKATQQPFRFLRWQASVAEVGDQLLLLDYVPLALGDMLICKLKIGFRVSHGSQ